MQFELVKYKCYHSITFTKMLGYCNLYLINYFEYMTYIILYILQVTLLLLKLNFNKYKKYESEITILSYIVNYRTIDEYSHYGINSCQLTTITVNRRFYFNYAFKLYSLQYNTRLCNGVNVSLKLTLLK